MRRQNRFNTDGLTDRATRRVQTLRNTGRNRQAKRFIRRQRSKMAESESEPLAENPIKPLDTSAVNTPKPTPEQTQAKVNTLFPSTRMFEPKNYEGSPLYKFQVKQGQDQLAKSLAARGLTNSGYAIGEELDIPLRVAAQDTDRMTRIAAENADRLKSFQDNEALRLERAENNQWNRAFDVAQLLADQSPWNSVVNSIDASAKLKKEAAANQANYLKQAYASVFGGGGGGGGGSVKPPLPLPSGPSYINIRPTEIQQDYDSSTGWGNVLTNALGSLFN